MGLSLLLVLPLLLAYEVTTAVLQPPVRNGAEQIVANFLRQLSPDLLTALRHGVVLLLMILALVLLTKRPPRVARAHWILGEALLGALLLGPLLGTLLGSLGLSAPGEPLPSQAPVWLPFLLSVGAGLWEELVFRLALMGGLLLLLVQVFRVPRRTALLFAVLVSALLFALYHHVGSAGEPLAPGRFVFRAAAGTILGLLFAARGLAVVVYMHVFYDLLCDLRTLA
ncbi:MAG: CPBP family intramembrane glutamic endopeptidase [Planctomycetota bacterium]